MLFILGNLILNCQKKQTDDKVPEQGRIFQTSFESVSDFTNFYITPQNTTNSNHDLVSEQVHSGTYAHKGWILAANSPSTPTVNNNHRAYPTVQLYKTEFGAYKTPVLIEFWVWLDATIAPGEWVSLATLDHTTDDVWDGVLVNVNDQGIIHLMHVPLNGQGVRTFQTTTTTIPLQTWVKVSVEIHFDSTAGYAKVWQNDELVSTATVGRGDGYLTQCHFGLYAPPEMSSATIYNDDLTIKENSVK